METGPKWDRSPWTDVACLIQIYTKPRRWIFYVSSLCRLCGINCRWMQIEFNTLNANWIPYDGLTCDCPVDWLSANQTHQIPCHKFINTTKEYRCQDNYADCVHRGCCFNATERYSADRNAIRRLLIANNFSPLIVDKIFPSLISKFRTRKNCSLPSRKSPSNRYLQVRIRCDFALAITEIVRNEW